MKKILAILTTVFMWTLLVGVTLDPGSHQLFKPGGASMEGDIVVKNDTIWTDDYSVSKYGTAGYFSLSWDLDSINGDVTGEIILQETNIPDNYNKTTVVFAWATKLFNTNDVDTTLKLDLLGTGDFRLGVANTSATASDSFQINKIRIYSTGQ